MIPPPGMRPTPALHFCSVPRPGVPSCFCDQTFEVVSGEAFVSQSWSQEAYSVAGSGSSHDRGHIAEGRARE